MVKGEERHGGTMVFVPLDELATPKDGEVKTSRWWVFDRERNSVLFIEKGKRWYVPQCNANRELAKHIQGKLYPELDIIHIPVAFLGHLNPSD